MGSCFSFGAGALSELARLRQARSKRVSSYDRTGRNRDCVAVGAGKSHRIATIRGAGCIRHIWMTVMPHKDDLNDHYLRKLVLRMWWDGERTPSVEVPLGDFFGVGHGVTHHFISLPLNMITNPNLAEGQLAGMNCFFPMPFAREARIELENQSTRPLTSLFYYIDYEQYEKLEDDEQLGRFHAQYRQEYPCEAVKHRRPKGALLADSRYDYNTTGDENYVILQARGRGHYVGCVLSIDNFNAFNQNYLWFGEGDDMIFIDGEPWPPSLHGTGTEDYFCSAWCYPSGAYSGPYHGVSLGSDTLNWSGRWTMYRFHIEDPIHFHKSIRVTIEHGHANNQGNDYSSVAFWYQREPHGRFPKLPPMKKRLPRSYVR